MDAPYIWFFTYTCIGNATGATCFEATVCLFTTENPTGAWSQIPMISPPRPAYGLYDSLFAVAPNSVGDGNNDILFFGSVVLFRSIDSGRTWMDTWPGKDWFHADYHALVFFPADPTGPTVPAAYIGCDGGLGVSTLMANPNTTFPPAAGDANELANYSNTAVVQNYNHGKQSPNMLFEQ